MGAATLDNTGLNVTCGGVWEGDVWGGVLDVVVGGESVWDVWEGELVVDTGKEDGGEEEEDVDFYKSHDTP